MGKIAVKALYNEKLNFLGAPVYDGPDLVSITPFAITLELSSVQGPTRYLPGSQTPLQFASFVVDIPLLSVRDPYLGTFYLDMTQDEFNEALSLASQSPNKEITLEHTVGADEVGVEFTFPELINSTINIITLDGGIVNLSSVTYVSSTGTIFFEIAPSEGSIFSIVYHKN